MKKKIFGILLTLVLAVTGFGLVGCGGGNNPAPGPGPGPGPEPAPEVSYDDDLTPVAVEDTGLLFELYTAERMEEEGWDEEYITDYNQAFVWAMTEEVENLVIPAYVTDGENEYRVTEVDNLVCTINIENHNYIGVNEQAQSVKTITIPSTVEYFAGIANRYDHPEDPEDEESEWISEPVYMENLESIILNNRTTNIDLLDAANWLMNAILEIEYSDGYFTEEERGAVYATVLNLFCTYDEENDMYYTGNPSNPYMLLFTAGDSYWEELPEGEFEMVANVNENCKIIGDCAFDGAQLTSINLPNRLTAIGYDAFVECTNLSTLVISETVKYLGTDIVWHGDNTDTYIKSADVLKYLDNFGSDSFYVLVSIMDESDVEFENYIQAEDTVTFGGEEYYLYEYFGEL